MHWLVRVSTNKTPFANSVQQGLPDAHLVIFRNKADEGGYSDKMILILNHPRDEGEHEKYNRHPKHGVDRSEWVKGVSA